MSIRSSFWRRGGGVRRPVRKVDNLTTFTCRLSRNSESLNLLGGPGSSVGIATELRVGRFGIESRWGRDFPPVQPGPGAHPGSCKMGTGSFPGVTCGRGVPLTTQPLLVTQSRKSRAIPLPTLWVKPGL